MTVLGSYCGAVEAAAPVVEYLYPAGGQRGTTVTVTAGGKFEPWPLKAWTNSAELKFEAGEKNGTFVVQVGASVSPGPHLVRLHNGEGASALRVFMVGEQKEIAETEPNDEVGKAQSIEGLPLTVNGQLEKAGDVDAFGVRLEAGQCLVASLQGRRLGAPMDPMLHLFDEAGNEIAFAHDGFGLDPLLVHRAAVAGRFVVRVSGFAHPPAADVRLTGAKSDVYRLHLTTGPVVRWASPAGVKRGERKTVRLFGWNLAAERWEADATDVKAGQEYLPAAVGANDVPMRIELSDLIEVAEAEITTGQAPAARFGVTGRIAAVGEEDRYSFTAKKGERAAIVLRGGFVESRFDPVLRVEDAPGKQLARDDDGAGAGDAKVEFAAPEDGIYRVVVSDLNRQGGEDFDYRLTVSKAVPEVTAVVGSHEVRVTPGKTAAVKVNVSRAHGHDDDVAVIATGLPAGVTSSSASVPAKGGEVEVTLSAAADAKIASGAVRFVLVGTDPEKPFARVARYDLRKEAVGQTLVEATEAVWLTVLPPPATQPAKAVETPPKK
jgi:hypothetical protein